MPQSYSDSEIASAQAYQRQNVQDFIAGPQTSFENPGAIRPDGRTWVAATGREGSGQQQTV